MTVRVGSGPVVPFSAIVVAIVLTDLLIGILIGLAVGIGFIHNRKMGSTGTTKGV